MAGPHLILEAFVLPTKLNILSDIDQKFALTRIGRRDSSVPKDID